MKEKGSCPDESGRGPDRSDDDHPSSGGANKCDVNESGKCRIRFDSAPPCFAGSDDVVTTGTVKKIELVAMERRIDNAGNPRRWEATPSAEVDQTLPIRAGDRLMAERAADGATEAEVGADASTTGATGAASTIASTSTASIAPTASALLSASLIDDDGSGEWTRVYSINT